MAQRIPVPVRTNTLLPKMSPLGPEFKQAPRPQGLSSISRMRIPPGQMNNYRRLMPTNTHFSALTTSQLIRKDGDQVRAFVSQPSALVLYDSALPYGFIGNLYARQLAALLRTTGRSVDIAPVEGYTAGKMNTYAQTFYLGILYDNPLPAAFKADVLASTKPICWSGYNLWQIAWTPDWTADNTAFTTKFGIRFVKMDSRAFKTVVYKGKELVADVGGDALANVKVLNATKATVLAEAATKANARIPYMVKANNLYVVADNPLANGSTWTSVPRTFAFEDVIHDIVSDGAVTDHPAVLRIEDVHAESDPVLLQQIADYLYSVNVPYVVCVIPHYRDPLGYWNYGTAVDETISQKPALVAVLQYMSTHGGEIIMHGDTHQYDDVNNPGSGVSGDDYEFFRVVHDDASGTEINYGPTFEDSPAWVNGRLDEGFAILGQAGFNPTGWNTPHYLASPVDYQAFQQRFSYSFCRGKNFSIDSAGYLYMLEQEPSVPIVDDFGMYRFPETLGYVSTPDLGVLKAEPKNMVNRSKKVLVDRKAWAGCFFHWFLPVSMLQELVTGVKANGYHFVAPKAYYTANH